MTDDLLTSDEVRAILRVERTALARYLVGPDRIPHLRLGNPRTGPLRIRRSALEEWIVARCSSSSPGGVATCPTTGRG